MKGSGKPPTDRPPAQSAQGQGFSVLQIAKFDCTPSLYRVLVRLEEGRAVTVFCGIHALWNPGRFARVLLRKLGVVVSVPKPAEWRQGVLKDIPVKVLGVPVRRAP